MDDSELLYQHLASTSLWSERERDWSISGATEIWSHSDRANGPKRENRLEVRHREFLPSDDPDGEIEAWLSAGEEGGSDGKLEVKSASARLARIVFLSGSPSGSGSGSGSETIRSPRSSSPQRVIDLFGLRLAHAYALSCIAGVVAFPASPDSAAKTYALIYHPKLAALWSWSAGGIQAVIFADGADERAALLRSLLSAPPTECWWRRIAAHPMFPALLCSLALSRAVDATHEAVKADIRRLEARTGHHTFARRAREPPAEGDLAVLSALASGRAAKLASTARKVRVAREAQAFVLSHAPQSPGEEIVRRHARLADKRLEMQMLDNEYSRERVRIQLDVLFNLIAQNDNLIAQQTARASEQTARASAQDSSMMKALTLVALLFLPGNFVAALFSAPLFYWEDTDPRGIGVRTKPQFGLFWVIALPLTAAAFFAYAAWWQVQKRRWGRGEP